MIILYKVYRPNFTSENMIVNTSTHAIIELPIIMPCAVKPKRYKNTHKQKAVCRQNNSVDVSSTVSKL